MFPTLVLVMLTLVSPLLAIHFAAVSAFRTGWHWLHGSSGPRWGRRVLVTPLALLTFVSWIPQGFVVALRPVYARCRAAAGAG